MWHYTNLFSRNGLSSIAVLKNKKIQSFSFRPFPVLPTSTFKFKLPLEEGIFVRLECTTLSIGKVKDYYLVAKINLQDPLLSWTREVKEWCIAFRSLINILQFEKVHLFGSALGGFLAQKFAEFTHSCPRVSSLILCNSFNDTSVFQYSDQSSM